MPRAHGAALVLVTAALLASTACMGIPPSPFPDRNPWPETPRIPNPIPEPGGGPAPMPRLPSPIPDPNGGPIPGPPSPIPNPVPSQARGVSCGGDWIARSHSFLVLDVLTFRNGDTAHIIAPLRSWRWVPKVLAADRDAAFVVYEHPERPERGFTDYFLDSTLETSDPLSTPHQLRLALRRTIEKRCRLPFKRAQEVAWNLPDYPERESTDAPPLQVTQSSSPASR